MGFLEDGRGTGRAAEVDTEFKVRTAAITESEFAHAGELGDAFQIGSSYPSLTTSDESAILYIRNNGERPLFVESFDYSWNKTAGIDGGALLSIYKNITAGTVLDNALSAEVRNYNLGSPKQFNTAYRGVQGDTFSSAEYVTAFFFDCGEKSDLRSYSTRGIVLIPGQSLGITITPPTGVSGGLPLVVGVSLNCFYKIVGTSE